MRLHTESDHEVCQKCSKNYLQNSELTIHIEIIHLCSDVFALFVMSE